jgi:hypothetical protein
VRLLWGDREGSGHVVARDFCTDNMLDLPRVAAWNHSRVALKACHHSVKLYLHRKERVSLASLTENVVKMPFKTKSSRKLTLQSARNSRKQIPRSARNSHKRTPRSVGNSRKRTLRSVGQFLSPQNAKPPTSFLDLPPEVRDLVYRELLVSDGPLRGRFNRPPAANLSTTTVESYNLHPAILRTCQKVYLEAKGLLYKNTLCIELRYPYTRWPKYDRDALPVVWIPAFEGAPLVKRGCPDNQDTWKMKIVDSSKDFALRFSMRKIEVQPMCPGVDYWDMKEALPLMQPIFEKGGLEVSILPDPRQGSLQRHLPFLMIRCAEFRITGVPPEEIKRLTDIITSSQPVPDMEGPRRDLDDAVEFIHYHRYGNFEGRLKAIEDELQTAQDAFYMEKFEIARAKLLVLFNQVDEYARRAIEETATRIRTRVFGETISGA